MQHDPIQKAALWFTRWVGSVASIIVHTVFFAVCFAAVEFGYLGFNQMLLILTTIVSLEAIYLAIFIQMTINLQAQSIQEVSADVEEIAEDIEEIQGDVDELQEDVEDISEDVEEMNEEDEKKLANHVVRTETLAAIHADLRRLIQDVQKLKEE